MRGVRDLVLVATVAVVATALSAIGTGPSVAERGSPSAAADIAAGVMPVRVGPAAGDRARTQDRPRRASPAAGTARGANDLRAFLANMASADRDGHTIGIARQDAGALWVDDAAK